MIEDDCDDASYATQLCYVDNYFYDDDDDDIYDEMMTKMLLLWR